MAAQKVLIVDDSKLMRLQVREMLPSNMNVIEAVDGADGFEQIRKQNPQLLIMDCFMPKMNGWQVVNKMLSYPELQRIPVVLMSGRRDDVEENAPELFDYFEFLEKPFDKNKLIQAIKLAMVKAKKRKVEPPASAAPPPPAAVPSTVPSTPEMAATVALDATTALQKLQSEVQELRQNNADMRAEMKQMKQQIAQLTKIIKQSLSRV